MNTDYRNLVHPPLRGVSQVDVGSLANQIRLLERAAAAA
jgi:hypothetical protein